MTLTWAATTRQPAGVRTQVCVCRPTLPGADARRTRVEQVARSAPKVVTTVPSSPRASPAAGRALRNAAMAAWPYRFSAPP